MIKHKVIIIIWSMVIIQKLLKSMEVLFSVKYIITPLFIYGVFNGLFPVLPVIPVYYCIGDPVLHLYSIRELQCFSFAQFPPFYLRNAQLMFHILVKDSYHFTFVLHTPHFYLPCCCVNSNFPFLPPMHIEHDTTLLKTHTISLSLFYSYPDQKNNCIRYI